MNKYLNLITLISLSYSIYSAEDIKDLSIEPTTKKHLSLSNLLENQDLEDSLDILISLKLQNSEFALNILKNKFLVSAENQIYKFIFKLFERFCERKINIKNHVVNLKKELSRYFNQAFFDLVENDKCHGFCIDTILHIIASYGHVSLVEACLLQYPKDINLSVKISGPNAYGYNPGHLAIMHNNLDVLKLLISKGINTNKFPAFITLAAEHDKVDMFKFLLSISNGKYDLQELLDSACRNSSLNVIKELIPLGVDINKKNSAGYNALGYALGGACKSNNLALQVIDFLIANGADISIAGQNNRTPLCSVVRYHYPIVIVEKILSYSDSLDSNLLRESIGNSEVLKLLLNKFDTNIEVKDKDGNTLLLLAKNKEVIELLESKGADINAKNYLGQNLLHKMCKNYKRGYDFDMILYALEKNILFLSAADNTGNYALNMLKFDRENSYELNLLETIEANLYDETGNAKLVLKKEYFYPNSSYNLHRFLLQQNIDIESEIIDQEILKYYSYVSVLNGTSAKFNFIRDRIRDYISSGDIDQINQIKSLSLFFSHKQISKLIYSIFQNKDYPKTALIELLKIVSEDFDLGQILNKFQE